MAVKFICGSNKYTTDGDVIYLPVVLKGLPEEIKVKDETLYFPTPFHVSLVYIRKIIEKYNISIPDFPDKIIDDFCEFTKANTIEVIRYTNEFKFVNRDGTKKTVIVMCEVKNLNRFYDFINKKYGLNIKYPVPHVTLYNTLKGEPGIYLMDQDDIKSFTTPIKNPINHDTINP